MNHFELKMLETHEFISTSDFLNWDYIYRTPSNTNGEWNNTSFQAESLQD